MLPTGSLPPSPVHTGFTAFRRALPYFVVVVVIAAAVQAVVDRFFLEPRLGAITDTLSALAKASDAGGSGGEGPLRDLVALLLPSAVVSAVFTVLQLAVFARLGLSAVDADRSPDAAPRAFGTDMWAVFVRLPAFVAWMAASAVAVYVGLALCILPGLLLMWGLSLLPFFVIEKAPSPVVGSFRMARAKVVALVAVAFIGVGGLFLTLVLGQAFAALPFALGRFVTLVASGLLIAFVMCALAATYRMPAPQRPLAPGIPAPPAPGTQVNPWESIPHSGGATQEPERGPERESEQGDDGG